MKHKTTMRHLGLTAKVILYTALACVVVKLIDVFGLTESPSQENPS